MKPAKTKPIRAVDAHGEADIAISRFRKWFPSPPFPSALPGGPAPPRKAKFLTGVNPDRPVFGEAPDAGFLRPVLSCRFDETIHLPARGSPSPFPERSARADPHFRRACRPGNSARKFSPAKKLG